MVRGRRVDRANVSNQLQIISGWYWQSGPGNGGLAEVDTGCGRGPNPQNHKPSLTTFCIARTTNLYSVSVLKLPLLARASCPFADLTPPAQPHPAAALPDVDAEEGLVVGGVHAAHSIGREAARRVQPVCVGAGRH